jgi:hypothetical protein
MRETLEKKLREEAEKEKALVMGSKATASELATFEELRGHYSINYNAISEFDVLADAMHAAETLD